MNASHLFSMDYETDNIDCESIQTESTECVLVNLLVMQLFAYSILSVHVVDCWS